MSSPGRLFGRQIAVTIAQPQPDSFFGILKNAIRITGLRIVFDIEKSLKPDPNPCTITIYNLTTDTRTRVTAKPRQIRIEAGYKDQIETLFLGDLQQSSTKREGADLATKILVADGDRAYQFARVTPRALSSGTSAHAQIGEIAGSMGLSIPRSVDDARAFVTTIAASGATMQGPARNEMTRVLQPLGYSWSIQNGQLQILKDGEGRADAALLVSADTGMIDSPELGSPGAKGEAPKLTVKHLLLPAAIPGRKIFVDAEFTRGTFLIEKVKHSGDTDGDDWTTTMECVAL